MHRVVHRTMSSHNLITIILAEHVVYLRGLLVWHGQPMYVGVGLHGAYSGPALSTQGSGCV